MTIFSPPSKKLNDYFIKGNVKKAEKLLKKKQTECLHPYLHNFEETLSLAGALKTQNTEEAKSILASINKVEGEYNINEGDFPDFFYTYWKPVSGADKIEVDNNTLLIASKYFCQKLFLKQLFDEKNIPHESINLDKVSFVLELIIKENIHKDKYLSIYFLKGLCLLAEYKPQILKSVVSKNGKHVKYAMEQHKDSPETETLKIFIVSSSPEPKVA